MDIDKQAKDVVNLVFSALTANGCVPSDHIDDYKEFKETLIDDIAEYLEATS